MKRFRTARYQHVNHGRQTIIRMPDIKFGDEKIIDLLMRFLDDVSSSSEKSNSETKESIGRDVFRSIFANFETKELFSRKPIAHINHAKAVEDLHRKLPCFSISLKPVKRNGVVIYFSDAPPIWCCNLFVTDLATYFLINLVKDEFTKIN